MPHFRDTGLTNCNIGGPHVALDMIWPVGIIVPALTSSHVAEIRSCVHMMKTTHAGTAYMHEAF